MPSSTSIAINVFGILGAVLWSIQLIPQIYKSYRRKTTSGFSVWMMVLWCIAGIFLGAYNIVSGTNLALVIQPQSFFFLGSIAIAQYFLYDTAMDNSAVVAIWAAGCLLSGGLETAFYFAAKAGIAHGTTAPERLFGIIAAIAINIGFVPQYMVIYRKRRVFGISLPFLFIDMLGGVASLVSVALAKPVDIINCITYGLLVVLELIIFALAAILKNGPPEITKAEKPTSDVIDESTLEIAISQRGKQPL